MARLIRYVETSQVTQEEILALTGRTELAANERLALFHMGEDGPMLCLEIVRSFSIEEQSGQSMEGMQEWYCCELADTWYLESE